MIECVVVKNVSDDKIKSIESVEHVDLLDPLEATVRLQEIASLKDGWFDGTGIAPPKDGLTWLDESFSSRFGSELPLPRLYPTPAANVLGEWLFGRNDVSLEIDLLSRRGEYSALDLDTGESEDETLDLGQDKGWQRLNERLEALGSVREITA